MYKVIDIISGKVVCESADKRGILTGRNDMDAGRPSLFARHSWELRFNAATGRNEPCRFTEMDFSELNVSGRDIKPCARWAYRWNGVEFVSFQISNGPMLRRYQVLDENGRSVDIRTWMAEIEAIKNGVEFGNSFAGGRTIPSHLEPGHRREPCGAGAKRTMHRAGCSAMWKQNVIDGCRYRGSGDGDNEYAPVLDRTQPRRRVDPINGRTDNVFRFGGGNRCWKKQRSARQWGKHKKIGRKELATARAIKGGLVGINEGLVTENCA